MTADDAIQPTSSQARDSRNGLISGAGAYLLWGFLPMYFPLLEPATPLHISAHRVVWSWVVCVILLIAVSQWRTYTALLRDRQVMPRLALAAILLSSNWLIFLIGVLSGRVVEASLGYFMNPIVTVLLAVVFLRERISRAQIFGITIAGVGMIVLTVENGTVPWISISLAGSFGVYSLIKKQVSAKVPALVGLATETTALLPIALGYLGVLAYLGQSTFGVATGPGGTRTAHVVLLVFSGVVTAAPLLLFAVATRRIPLVTIGMIQFMTPIMQFLTGIFFFHETMSRGRWIGFICVWVALIILSGEALRNARKRPQLASGQDPR